MCPNSRSMFELQHYRTHDGPGLTLHAMPMMRARWDRLTAREVLGIRTPWELIGKVEESYSLSHEQATRDVEFWALDKQL